MARVARRVFVATLPLTIRPFLNRCCSAPAEPTEMKDGPQRRRLDNNDIGQDHSSLRQLLRIRPGGPMTPIRVATVLLVVVILTCGTVQAQDRTRWLGTYEGTWKSAQNSGGYVLVIERVEGNKVFGKRTASHPTLRGPSFGTASFAGTVDGETIKLVGTDSPGEATLTRNGDELTGSAAGTVSSELKLKKVK
jgi:hypothetical protein